MCGSVSKGLDSVVAFCNRCGVGGLGDRRIPVVFWLLDRRLSGPVRGPISEQKPENNQGRHLMLTTHTQAKQAWAQVSIRYFLLVAIFIAFSL